MARTTITENTLKEAMKEALTETLLEQRDLLRRVFAEVFEEFALSEAIREGQKTKPATRGEIFRLLRGRVSRRRTCQKGPIGVNPAASKICTPLELLSEEENDVQR